MLIKAKLSNASVKRQRLCRQYSLPALIGLGGGGVWALGGLLLVGVGAVTAGLAYRSKYRQNTPHIDQTDAEVGNPMLFARDRAWSELDSAVRSRGIHVVLAGEPGTGKSTLMKQYARRNESTVMYVRCSPGTRDLAKALTEAVTRHGAGLSVEETSAISSEDVLHACKDRLFTAARQHLRQSSSAQPMVVVLDNLDMVCASKQPAWGYLLDMVKEAADTSVMKVVLVTSLGQDLKQIKRNKSLRWTITSTLELTDLTDEEAWECIQHFCGDAISRYPQEALRGLIRESTGGRMAMLMDLVRVVNSDGSLTDIKDAAVAAAHDALHAAGMTNPHDPRHDTLWKLADMILQSPEKRVHLLVVRMLLDDVMAMSDWDQVFSCHVDGSVTFQSRACQTIAASKLADKKAVAAHRR